METSINNAKIDKYVSEILKLDDLTKSKIIEKISKSFTFRKNNHNQGISELFGAWDNNDSSDEIINVIYSARKDKEIDENIFE